MARGEEGGQEMHGNEAGAFDKECSSCSCLVRCWKGGVQRRQAKSRLQRLGSGQGSGGSSRSFKAVLREAAREVHAFRIDGAQTRQQQCSMGPQCETMQAVRPWGRAVILHAAVLRLRKCSCCQQHGHCTCLCLCEEGAWSCKQQ
jgi:hypothetical protein